MLEPGHLVSGDAEGIGVRFGEHVVAVEFAEDPRGSPFVGATRLRAVPELGPPVAEDGFLLVGAAVGTTELLGLGGSESRNVDGELVELILEEHDAQGALEGRDFELMLVMHGAGGAAPNELAELEQKIEAIGMTAEAKEKAVSELNKLKMMSPMSAEATVLRSYIEWLTNVPWNKRSPVKKDLSRAEVVLNEDHYGLEKVKERILEYLAVQQRVKKLKGPILCLVGPPGVGKTSLGQSVAKATGRKYVRMALGGVRDEAEIRGHRRTYIGAMPGRIIQSIRRCGSNNPVFMLDEIDKLGVDFRGDPASALLELLDPEQNTEFIDRYLEVPVDVSSAMFISTANYIEQIPPPLRDRMEIIYFRDYTVEEKRIILERYLIPKSKKEYKLEKMK